MDKIAVTLTADATPWAPALVLRPWRPGDAVHLVALYQDEAMRHWLSSAVEDEAGGARWVEQHQLGWETGEHFAFAVVETETGNGDGEGRLAGHVVLKGLRPGATFAEVGYWTAAYSRGRGVASRALHALTDWAFTTFSDRGLTRLELLHQLDNVGSCRVAERCGYALTSTLPAAPPDYPLDAHVHTRTLAP
ncbi:GNAT family N-acetyltransferase [Actinacidiphila rubida]|uniref:Protein N-acetyltransferase, RimJ/RimL family n=1 Tax=Actinacidiphila rubida TaxID=310780 RepID=A0A1H8NGY8_9ACTN|nr:GNAT family N-acetyltransferase [Actinacidiphila rubida]SEO28826.1 Protein N-acetyltransferase, RimJ/RimL family [Actinacidiphila rubida]